MNKFDNPEVEQVFKNYPDHMREKLLNLRQLIFDTAAETPAIGKIEEALKWGEPSYLAKNGSTIRIDAKSSSPDQYAMYFNCNTTLVDTFKELYKTDFRFEGNRAIVFDKSKNIPVEKLKSCIIMSLNYHKVKHLPMLGA